MSANDLALTEFDSTQADFKILFLDVKQHTLPKQCTYLDVNY